MKTARFVDSIAERFGRRGFLTSTAVAATALAMEPLTYLLEPVSAYAAVCSCGAQGCDCGAACCDGYTEFCCTLNGENKCPPGTLMAGWWKVDDSPYCGAPRYYMDCNSACNGCGCGSNGVCSGACSGSGCGCAGGDCNNRVTGCNEFRYGQCHQEVACVGPIVCRVATCIPPWQIDPTCSGTVRVDEATRFHNRDCLHGTTGFFDYVVDSTGGPHVVGWALDKDLADPIAVEAYVGGALVARVPANAYRPDVGAYYPGWGDYHGFDFTLADTHLQSLVCLRAVGTGYPGVDADLGCKTYVPTIPFGALETIAAAQPGLRVAGWAIDPQTSGPVTVRVRSGSTVLGQTTANRSRPDVASRFPQYPGNHGFDATIPVAAGRREVCVEIVNVGAGVDRVLGCQTVTEPPACVSTTPHPPAQSPASRFTALAPRRIADTRPGQLPSGGRKTALASADVFDLVVTGGGVPTDASAVVLNVTAVLPSQQSYITAWPAGERIPQTSNLNFAPVDVAFPNCVITGVGCDGKVNVFNAAGNTDVVVDLMGYFPAGSGYAALSPARLLDTRPGTQPAGGRKTPIGAGATADLAVTGGAVPANASAVVVNVTAVGPKGGASHMTVWPTGEARPSVSNLNYTGGMNAFPNLAIVKVGAGGRISLFNSVGSTDAIVDLVGYFPAGTDYSAPPARRLLDTRPGTNPPGGTKTRLGAGATTSVTVTGGTVPADARAVVLNVTAVGPTAVANMTVWPAGETRPLASHLNYRAGIGAFAKLVVCKVGSGGAVNLYNSAGTTDAIVDLMGYFPAA